MAHPSRPGLTLLWLLCGALLSVACGPRGKPAEVPESPAGPAVAAVEVDAGGFASAVVRLLRDGGRTPQRSALLAGTVRRQLRHAAAYFDRGDTELGARAVTGALYLLRLGERRRDMFGPDSIRALAGAIESFSARGDEGRALSLMTQQLELLPPGSAEHRDLQEHLRSLRRWMSETRTGKDMLRLGAEEKAKVARALLEPTEAALGEAVKAVDKWIERAVEYNREYRRTGELPPRDVAIEAFRALHSGPSTLAALFLRHGLAKDAVKAIDATAAHNVVDRELYLKLRAAAMDDTGQDWRLLARHFSRAAFEQGDVQFAIDPELLDAALWGISIEAYRRDPTSLAIGHILAGKLIDLGLPEVAPLILSDALGPSPSIASLSAAMTTVAEALSRELMAEDPATARRIFAASGSILALGESDSQHRVRPSVAQLRLLMAAIELRAGQVDTARPLMVAALRSEPTVHGYTMLGRLERQAGNPDVALAHARQATLIPAARLAHIDVVEAKLLEFEVLRDQGEPQRAAEPLGEALQLALQIRDHLSLPVADQVRIERLLARILDGYGERPQASKAIGRALEIASAQRQVLGQAMRSAVGRALTYGDLSSARTALRLGLTAQVDEAALVRAALGIMLLERAAGELPDGKVERVLYDALDDHGWTGAIAKWGRGLLSDAQLQQAAANVEQRIEAKFFISLKARIDGRREAATKLQEVANAPLFEIPVVQLARDILAPEMHIPVPSRLQLPE